MRDTKLTIIINKTPAEIFTFLLDPKNTPQWIPSIIKEEVNEYPTKLGTIYRNIGESGEWSVYTVSEFEQNQHFVFTSEDSNYHCRYTLTPISDHTTELEYYEWVNTGELKEPFTQDLLENLKKVIE